jgi:hypothetical protein
MLEVTTMPAPANVVTLPASYDEAIMMQFARDWLAAVRACDFLALGDPFNNDAARALVRRVAANLADLHERNAARLVDLALAGAEEINQGLMDLIAERNAAGIPLGAALATYVNITGDRPPELRRPHSRPRDNILADFIIIVLIIELMKRFPMLSLRRSSRKKPCAFSITAAALVEAGIGRGSEEAIRKIWERYGPPVNPHFGFRPRK